MLGPSPGLCFVLVWFEYEACGSATRLLLDIHQNHLRLVSCSDLVVALIISVQEFPSASWQRLVSSVHGGVLLSLLGTNEQD